MRLSEQGAAVRIAKAKTATYRHALNNSPHYHDELIFLIHNKRHRLDFEVYVRVPNERSECLLVSHRIAIGSALGYREDFDWRVLARF